MTSEEDQRKSSGIRRDINDLVRDDASGKVSGSKIGTYAGQYISGYLLLTQSDDVLSHWDSLAILLTALMLPEMLKKFITMKWGGGGAFTQRTEHSKETTTQTVDRDKP